MASKNPKNTKKAEQPSENFLVQQRFWIYRPVFSPCFGFVVFIILGLTFIPIGVLIWLTSDNIQDQVYDYTFCKSDLNKSFTCDQFLKNYHGFPDDKITINNYETASTGRWPKNTSPTCSCTVHIQLTEPIKGPVYMFYRMTNYYQNRLRYFRSRDDYQLRGKIGEVGNLYIPSETTEPRRRYQGKIVFPAGVLADSMFNDSITLSHHNHMNDSTNILEIPVNLIRTGIAWKSDKERKFRNPPEFKDPKHPIWSHLAKPKNWALDLWDFDPINENNNGLENEDFIIWMRSAAFPTFRKLYRIVDSNQEGFEDGLPAGNYSLKIKYRYLVSTYGGSKHITLSNARDPARKNYFLSIIYIIIGIISILLSLICLGLHILVSHMSLRKQQ